MSRVTVCSSPLDAGATAYLRKRVPGPEIAKTLSDALQAKAIESQN